MCYLYLPALIFTCHFVTKGLETKDNKQGACKMPFFTASCFATCFWSEARCCCPIRCFTLSLCSPDELFLVIIPLPLFSPTLSLPL